MELAIQAYCNGAIGEIRVLTRTKIHLYHVFLPYDARVVELWRVVRWMIKQMGQEFRARKAVAELITIGNLDTFPVLVEKGNGMVAQSEKTLIVTKDACEIVT